MPHTPSIKMIVFDVDGVLTDGGIIVSDHGVESKRFHVRDGFAIKAAMKVGMQVGVITGRSTMAVTLRMTDLGVRHVLQGCGDKLVGLERLCQNAGVLPEETAYVGDDLIDLPALLRCGYPIAVKDAVEEVRAGVRYVTSVPGGYGAAREAIEHVLKLLGKWDQIVDQYA
ncbi:MAG: HAD-IIIA family hydrolase [Phycisphaeraceae bacterium]|nr:HAD-IIIA family hydrolase [Phycisphaeraceae bacterium]